MNASLVGAVAAPTELSDTELHALIGANYWARQIAPGLLACIDGALERSFQSADLDRAKLAECCLRTVYRRCRPVAARPI